MGSIQTVFSESPEHDIWKELLQFSYEANIKRYFAKQGIKVKSDILDCVAGSFLQAYEYYRHAKEASLQISPLLLYYGSTNLLNGMTILLEGSIPNISHHGMRLEPFKYKCTSIGDTRIKFLYPKKGGLHLFAKHFHVQHDLTQLGVWSLRDFLDSIAEIHEDYTRCYESKISRILWLDEYLSVDELIQRAYYTEDNRDDILLLFDEIDGFRETYLTPTMGEDQNDQRKFFILRHKFQSDPISESSYSGQPYLRAGHQKNGQIVTLPTILNMYISLFIMASLCRYHPERWSPFVLKDKSGEKLLIEKFLFFTRRMIPNIVLNTLLGTTLQYSSNRYEPINKIKYIDEHRAQDLIDERIQKQLDTQRIQKQSLLFSE